jgi:inosine-uridine nucleoside N-ribohydrolase
MKMKMKKLFWISIGLLCLFGMSCKKQAEPAVAVIFDTDMGPDYDDVGALAMLHAMADSGEVNILATVSSNLYANSVPCIELINRYFGRPDILVGAPQKGVNINDSARFAKTGYWPDILMARYPHEIKQTKDAPDAVSIYRQVLSKQPDSSVRIISTGFFTNLAALLQSKPDAYSDLDGTALVKKKVERLISMAGAFPQGREFNVFCDPAASAFVFEQWPTPITLSGFEIGDAILTGKKLAASDITDSPVKDAFSASLKVDVDGRPSWDETAVLVGVRGCRDYFGTVKGRIYVAPDGGNTWEDDPNGTQEHLVWKMPKEEVARIIEDMMMHKPGK